MHLSRVSSGLHRTKSLGLFAHHESTPCGYHYPNSDSSDNRSSLDVLLQRLIRSILPAYPPEYMSVLLIVFIVARWRTPACDHAGACPGEVAHIESPMLYFLEKYQR